MRLSSISAEAPRALWRLFTGAGRAGNLPTSPGPKAPGSTGEKPRRGFSPSSTRPFRAGLMSVRHCLARRPYSAYNSPYFVLR